MPHPFCLPDWCSKMKAVATFTYKKKRGACTSLQNVSGKDWRSILQDLYNSVIHYIILPGGHLY